MLGWKWGKGAPLVRDGAGAGIRALSLSRKWFLTQIHSGGNGISRYVRRSRNDLHPAIGSADPSTGVTFVRRKCGSLIASVSNILLAAGVHIHFQVSVKMSFRV